MPQFNLVVWDADNKKHAGRLQKLQYNAGRIININAIHICILQTIKYHQILVPDIILEWNGTTPLYFILRN